MTESPVVASRSRYVATASSRRGIVWSAQYSGSASILASPRSRVEASTPLRSQKSCQNCLISSALMSSARRPCFLVILSVPVVVVLQRLHAGRRFFLAPHPAVEEKADEAGEGHPDEDDVECRLQ